MVYSLSKVATIIATLMATLFSRCCFYTCSRATGPRTLTNAKWAFQIFRKNKQPSDICSQVHTSGSVLIIFTINLRYLNQKLQYCMQVYMYKSFIKHVYSNLYLFFLYYVLDLCQIQTLSSGGHYCKHLITQGCKDVLPTKVTHFT